MKLVLSEGQKTSYQEQGYLLLKNFAPETETMAVLKEARNIFMCAFAYHQIPHSVTGEDFEQRLYELFQKHPKSFTNCAKHTQYIYSLWGLGSHRYFIDAIRELGLQMPTVCTRPVLFFNSKHLAEETIYHTVPAHQDWASMEGSLDSVVIWVPLCDVPKELGALQVVPGSHKLGLLTDRYQKGFGLVDKFSDEDFLQVEVNRGDVLIFSSFLVHRSGINSTDHIRWSCHFRYNNMMHPEYGERNFLQPYIYAPKSKDR